MSNTNRLHNDLGRAWRELQSLLFDLRGLSDDQRSTIQRVLDQIASVQAEMRGETK